MVSQEKNSIPHPSALTAFDTMLLKAHLLRCALHSLSVGWNAILLFILRGCRTMCSSLSVSAWVNILQCAVFDHRVRWRLLLLHAGRQNLLQQVEVLELVHLGELDIELDVEVTEVMVTVRWHTLALDHLNSTCRKNGQQSASRVLLHEKGGTYQA